MTIQDLPNAKLSAATQGYLAIYIQLCDMLGAISDITGIEYDPRDVDTVNRACYDALSNAQDEVMKLVNRSIIDHICENDDLTEL